MYCDPDDHDDDLLYTVRRKYRAPVVPLAEQILTPALQPANRQPKKNQTSKNDGERDSCSDIVILDDSSSDDSDASSVICLDDDNSERNTKNGETFSDRNANDSDSALDEVEKALLSTVGISVCCNRQILKFRLSRDEPFLSVFKKLSIELKTDLNNLLLMRKGTAVQLMDTPDSLHMNLYEILELVTASEYADPLTEDVSVPRDKIKLKFQTSHTKLSKIISLIVPKDDQFSKILELYTSHCKLPPHSVMFSFNGESIDVETTPAKLELENDDIIDVHSADT